MALGLLHDGIDDHTVPHDTYETDDAKDDRKDSTAMKIVICSCKQRTNI